MQTTSSSRIAAIFTLGLAAAFPAKAADDVSLADLKAATRSLGFLQNPPRPGGFVVGVLYAPGSANGKSLGLQTADRIHALSGPTEAGVKAEIVAVGDLANRADRLDALYLTAGTAGSSAAIVDVARRKHLLIMSNDPACLDQHACMLMVRDTGRVEIILDSGLAQSAGVTFSSVFAMMVKHR